MKSFIVKLTGVLFVFLLTASPVSAITKGAFLDRELEHFKDKGAKGYLIWQYSGDRNAPLGDTDKWSIFRGDLGDPNDTNAICGAMKKWAGQYEFLGFNVYSLGQGRSGPLSSGQIADQLNALKNCGTNVVRVFIGRSCPGGQPSTVSECVKRMLSGAESAGVKLILSVGDASNGGGGMPQLTAGNLVDWFGGGYLSSLWPAFLQNTAAAAAGNGNIYGIELANEPHCGPINAASAYNQWANYGVGIAKQGSGNVGIGQMANDPNDACDGANTNLLFGNQQAGATMVSSHYYDDDERSGADQSADKIVPAGLKFYIGEAGLLGIKKFPPSGPIMDSSAGIEPKFASERRNIYGGNIGAQKSESIQGFQSSDFAGATQTNFAKEDNKFSEIFDPNTGGGELVPAALQEKVIYPDEQSNYTGYKEVYGAGKYYGSVPGNPETDCFDSHDAAQSTSPDPYARTQAHYRNLISLRVPGNHSGLQWQVHQPHIVKEAAGASKLTLTDEYFKELENCKNQVISKPVPAVATPVEGFFEAIANIIQSVVTPLWDAITDIVCDLSGKTNCHRTTLVVNKTATVFLPGSPDIENKAVGLGPKGSKQGALLTFFPASLINQLSKDVGFTNKSESGNVLGDTTDPNCADCIPHYQMHEVKYAFQRTSSCMLLPASIQTQRKTNCELK